MKKTTMILVLAMIALMATPLLAADTADTAKAAHGKEIQAKAASFESASLTANPDKLKDIAKVLGTQKGILSAKIDKESKMLNIVFDPSKASIEAIEKALATQFDDFDRKELKDTKWAPKNCAKCPSAAKCASKDKK
jgi:hypothetical protein